MTRPLTVLKCVGPKLVPFFKTVTIFFVLFGENSLLNSYFYCVIKCLPIASLMVFVLLHGMNFTDAYAYSRKILLGLFFSLLGDACLVWKNAGGFLPGAAMFAIAQLFYATAFGFKPFNWRVFSVCLVIWAAVYAYLLPGLHGVYVYVAGVYVTLILLMAWRAIARIRGSYWTWTHLVGCAGAISFMISDFVIAVDKFRFPVPYSHPVIMTTYYAAQLCIALSVVDSQVDDLLRATAPSNAAPVNANVNANGGGKVKAQ